MNTVRFCARSRARAKRIATALAFAALLPFARAAVAEEQTNTAKFATISYVWEQCDAGRAAFRLGRTLDAHKHLTECDLFAKVAFVEDALSEHEKRRLSEARSNLEDVRQRVARLWVFVDKPGAEIIIDGSPIAQAPYSREIGLKPGRHRVTAVLGGASAEGEYVIRAGQVFAARLLLREPPRVAAGGGVAVVAPVVLPAPAGTPPPAALKPRSWSPALAWTGVGVIAAGVGVGAGAYLVQKDAERDMERRGPAVVRNGCGPREATSPECSAYADAYSRMKTAREVGAVVLPVTAVVGAGLISAGVLWKGPDESGAKIQAAPTVGGVVISGQF